ncbi:unnamed protein product [Lactuca saligna]|uniref:Transposase MuDR plant domain-containing protein n=1 Tax=Lactuca saligna TaxID=75948 RepID=A0AA35Z8P6_LACSI|nr:unnamed protein product [Lactuca saligna]
MNPDYEQSQVLDVDEGHDYSKSIVPFIRSQGKESHVIQKEVVNHEIETQEEVITSAVETEEQLGTYHVQEPSCQADNGANTTTVDDYEPFVEDYSLYADYDAEFNVQTSFEKQPEVDYLEGMVSDDSGDAFYSESGHGSEDSGDDSDDSEYNVDESNIQFDVDVDMSEFHNAVDVDEHGILNNHSKDDGIGVVDFDNELEVIATDDYQFAGFHEDDRKRLLKELSKSSTCSHGEVHVKPFQIGQVFKTKVDVKNYMNSHAVATRRLSTWKAMYFNKIDPLNGRTMWPKSDCPFTLLPPKHKTQVGRPKKKRRRGVDEPNSQAVTMATLSSNRFFDLIKPGITTNALAHIGGSDHRMKPHLLQFQNCLPGLRSVHEVIFVASFPHLQVTIFESEAIGCREGCNCRATVERRRDDRLMKLKDLPKNRTCNFF